MNRSYFDECIDACNACADACDFCASACLKEPDVTSMSKCIARDMDCAQMCRLAASFMSRASELAAGLCGLCAQQCRQCAEECARHPMDHCQRCAQLCSQCADACERMGQAA